jgi:hypothetical protein
MAALGCEKGKGTYRSDTHDRCSSDNSLREAGHTDAPVTSLCAEPLGSPDSNSGLLPSGHKGAHMSEANPGPGTKSEQG